MRKSLVEVRSKTGPRSIWNMNFLELQELKFHFVTDRFGQFGIEVGDLCLYIDCTSEFSIPFHYVLITHTHHTHTYTHTHTHICIDIYIYINIYIESETKRKMTTKEKRGREMKN